MKSYTLLKGLCDSVQFLLNTVIIVTSFIRGQHHVFVIAIGTGECAILVLQTLQPGVRHRCYCLLIYNYSVILLCFVLNCHRTFLFSPITNLFLCFIFEHNILAADKVIHNLQYFIPTNKYRNKVYVIKPS